MPTIAVVGAGPGLGGCGQTGAVEALEQARSAGLRTGSIGVCGRWAPG
jgi:hypothetical protein